MAIQDPVKWFRRQTAPTSVTICALLVLGALLGTFAPKFALEYLALNENFPAHFWALLTYPYLGGISLFLVFTVMWIYWVGTMLERDLGSKKFAVVWLVASVIGILPLVILRESAFGMLVPGAIIVTIWATRNPNQTVMVFMIIPVAAKYIGIAALLGVFATYSGGTNHPWVGLAAVSGCIVGFFFARNQLLGLTYGKAPVNKQPRSQTRASKVYKQEYYDDVRRREKEREEKERLRKLFEGSLEDKK